MLEFSVLILHNEGLHLRCSRSVRDPIYSFVNFFMKFHGVIVHIVVYQLLDLKDAFVLGTVSDVIALQLALVFVDLDCFESMLVLFQLVDLVLNVRFLNVQQETQVVDLVLNDKLLLL